MEQLLDNIQIIYNRKKKIDELINPGIIKNTKPVFTQQQNKEGKFTIIVKLKKNSYMDKKINYMNLCINNNLHMTFHDIHININHPYASVFSNSKFQNKVKKLIENRLKNKKFKARDIDKYGRWLVLEFSDEDNATKDWRPEFYKILNEYLIKRAGKTYNYEHAEKDYYHYYFHNTDPTEYKNQSGELDFGKALYAVKKHYHGLGIFNPHISLCKDMDVDNVKSRYNHHLTNYIYNKSVIFGTDLDEIKINVKRHN